MLDGHLGGAEHGLEDGDVEPKYGHEQRKDDGGEQPEVLRQLVKGRGVLEDAPAAGADGHEVEPLPVYERPGQYAGGQEEGVEMKRGRKKVLPTYMTTKLIKYTEDASLSFWV